MALLTRKLLSLCTASQKLSPIIQFSRSGATYWNQDWKPGPYPKTQAEREAAAKRYGLIIEDYEPYPDDGTGFGDYPKLPIISAEARDPYEQYDYPAHRRNYGEVLHVHADMYGLDRVRNDNDISVSRVRQAVTFFGSCAVYFFLCWYFQGSKPDEKKPRQFPHMGEVHYTFERP